MFFSFVPNPGLPWDVYCGPEILSYLVRYFCPATTFCHKNCSIMADVDNVDDDSSSSSRPPDRNSSSADGKFMIAEGSAKEGWAVYCISWYRCVSCGVPLTKSGEWTEWSENESTGMHLETLPANINRLGWQTEYIFGKKVRFILPASMALDRYRMLEPQHSLWFWVPAGCIYSMCMCGILHAIFLVHSIVEPKKLQYSLDYKIRCRVKTITSAYPYSCVFTRCFALFVYITYRIFILFM